MQVPLDEQGATSVANVHRKIMAFGFEQSREAFANLQIISRGEIFH